MLLHTGPNLLGKRKKLAKFREERADEKFWMDLKAELKKYRTPKPENYAPFMSTSYTGPQQALLVITYLLKSEVQCHVRILNHA